MILSPSKYIKAVKNWESVNDKYKVIDKKVKVKGNVVLVSMTIESSDGRVKTKKKRVSPRQPIPDAKVELLEKAKKELENQSPNFTQDGLKNF